MKGLLYPSVATTPYAGAPSSPPVLNSDIPFAPPHPALDSFHHERLLATPFPRVLATTSPAAVFSGLRTSQPAHNAVYRPQEPAIISRPTPSGSYNHLHIPGPSQTSPPLSANGHSTGHPKRAWPSPPKHEAGYQVTEEYHGPAGLASYGIPQLPREHAAFLGPTAGAAVGSHLPLTSQDRPLPKYILFSCALLTVLARFPPDIVSLNLHAEILFSSRKSYSILRSRCSAPIL